jgi:GTPase
VSGLGVKDALYALTREIKRAKAEEAESLEASPKPWRP